MSAPTFASAHSTLDDAASAAAACAEACGERLRALTGSRTCDLAIVFYSPAHTPFAGAISAVVNASLSPFCLVGVSAETVIEGTRELENLPGLSILAARLPGATITPFLADHFSPVDGSRKSQDRISSVLRFDRDHRVSLFFADPYSIPLVRLLPAIDTARKETGAGPLFGGLASAGTKPGENALILNGRVLHQGALGVSISGPIAFDAVISQGCVPFGPTFVITRAKANLITELGGRPALEVVREAVSELPDNRREQLENGLLLGRVIDEYKERFGRSDYLIRPLLGAEESSQAIAVADLVRIGQTVRLHMRDAATAEQDLGLLLDAQKLHDPPAGALLVTCNARGSKLFSRADADATAVHRAFREQTDAPPATSALPLAGFSAAGEIGPVGPHCYVHGQTACLGLFRPLNRAADVGSANSAS